MRIFVTGATGFIGSAVARDLLGHGHDVVGLARSNAAADALDRAGVEPHRGALDDLASLQRGADAADAVVHCAFIHDFQQLERAGTVDSEAVEALGAALEGSGRSLAITSAIGVLRSGRLGTEEDQPDPSAHGSFRAGTEHAAAALARRGVRTAVVRLPPAVHGEGDRAFLPALVAIARTRGVSGYVGSGDSRWPAVHRDDAAALFRLAVERAPAGAVLHAVAEQGVPTRELASAVGRGLDLPAVAIDREDAPDHFGWLAPFLALDVPASSALTRERTGWAPVRAGVLEDLAEEHYYARTRPVSV